MAALTPHPPCQSKVARARSQALLRIPGARQPRIAAAPAPRRPSLRVLAFKEPNPGPAKSGNPGAQNPQPAPPSTLPGSAPQAAGAPRPPEPAAAAPTAAKKGPRPYGELTIGVSRAAWALPACFA